MMITLSKSKLWLREEVLGGLVREASFWMGGMELSLVN